MISMAMVPWPVATIQIVKGMDEGISVFLRQLIGMGAGLVIHIPVQHHLRPVALRPVHLHRAV